MAIKIKSLPLLVALDTQVFRKNHFYYNSSDLKNLIKLVQEEKIKLFITSVTVDEVKRYLDEKAQLIHQVVKNYENGLTHIHFQQSKDSKKLKIHPNSDLLNKFKEQVKEFTPTLDEIKQDLLNQFEVYFEQAKFEKIEIDGVSVEDVFKSYFSGIPPFSEKKKNEFPDAFALLAIQKAAKDKNKVICVVSEDSDWEKFCTSTGSTYLTYFKTVDDLLQNINKLTDPDVFDECYELFHDIENEIIEKIINEFPTLNFTIERIDISIEWGSEKIQVSEVEVEIIDTTLIDIKNYTTNQILVTFDLEINVDYVAITNYISTNQKYIKEDDDYYIYSEPMVATNPQSCNTHVEITLKLSRDEDNTLCNPFIESIYLNPDNNLDEIIIDLDSGYEDEY